MDSDKISFTPEQAAAVNHRGEAMLVSAAAGSGKTKVLVERLMSRVEDGDDVDEFLVITYTRAAAAELREKISDEILSRIAENMENRRLRRQSMLCRCAEIGTIHSFCTGILRENAHIAMISPDFRIIDENESEIIKAEVLNDILDEAYETIDKSDSFRALIDAVPAGRDDKRLTRMMLDMHAKLQSNPNPREWVKAQAKRLSLHGISDISETVWGSHLIEKTRTNVLYWRGEIARLREGMSIHPDFEAAYGNSIDATITGCDAFLSALDKGWEDMRYSSEIEFPRPKPVKGYDDLKNTRLKCKAGLSKCTDVFQCSSDEHIEDMKAVAPALTGLMHLILAFDSAYSAEKRSRGIADFSDLEHLTLSLLVDNETGEKTELAYALSGRFKEIMIDEYQDVNEVQELIFNAVSQEGKNIFMVGDVKQSIYRFRLADPSIFLAKYKSNDPALVLLSKNFRSRSGILDFVNYIFDRLMSEKFGEMDYTERERLIPGRGDTGDAQQAVELDIIDMSAPERDEDEESPAKTQMEARFIAQRISELTNGECTIPDGKGGARCIEYSDIVILLRSVSGKAWQYAGALSRLGIPAEMSYSEGYFETIEVSAALSLLSVIDNPLQDIPLAAVLRGRIYGFTADELAAIRIGSQGTDFYAALIKAAGTSEKCAAFLADIDALRAVAADMSADRFIWHVYNKTGLLGYVGAMNGGEKRRGNLILLAEHAKRIEQSGYKGLFGFLTYIRSLQSKGAELAGRDSGLSQNAVRIMSIHKSKGLEFPIVILADTSKQFNYKDMQKPLVMHPELGAGIKRIDRQRRIEYPTIARMAVQSKLKAEMLAEELRILYVAMTRAREKLIITATYKDAANEIKKYSGIPGGKIPPEVLEDIRSVAGWIFAALAPQAIPENVISASEPQSMRKTVIAASEPQSPKKIVTADKTRNDEQGDAQSPHSLDVRLIPATETIEEHDSDLPRMEKPVCMQKPPMVDSATENLQDSYSIEHLSEQYSFTYPHANAPDLPSKMTVTELKGRHADSGMAENAGKADYLKAQEARERRFTFGKPKFITETQGLTAAQSGTALHLAMQHIDFHKCVNTAGVRDELRRLAERGFLTNQQAEAVDAKKITRFFQSDIVKRVLKADDAKREFRFSLLCSAEDYFPGGGDDKILLQGIVDCFFEEDGELIVVDFKTDAVTVDTLTEKAKSYASQLTAYSDALERITGKHVKERIIYFFAQDAVFTV